MAPKRNQRAPRVVDPNLKENPAYVGKMEALMSALLPGDFVKLDLNFPPYYKAELATGFRGIVLKREDPRNEKDFTRYHWKNTGPAFDCRRGAVADGELEAVETGRIFTTGAFGGLPLDKYFGFEVVVICADSRQLPGTEESNWVVRDFWVFDTYVSPETNALLESRREEDMQFVARAARNAQLLAIEEMERINAHKRLGSNIGIPVPGFGTEVPSRQPVTRNGARA